MDRKQKYCASLFQSNLMWLQNFFQCLVLTPLSSVLSFLHELSKDHSFEKVKQTVNENALHSVCLAFVPVYLTQLMTGIFVVDMFSTTLIASVIVCCLTFGSKKLKYLLTNLPSSSALTVELEASYITPWGLPSPNPHYESMIWLLSKLSTKSKSGQFRVKLTPTEMSEDHLLKIIGDGATQIIEDDDQTSSTLNSDIENTVIKDIYVTPIESNAWIPIQTEGKTFHVKYAHVRTEYERFDMEKLGKVCLPSIYISRSAGTAYTLQDINDWIIRVGFLHQRFLKNTQKRSRYEYKGGYWKYVNTLQKCSGLQSLVLKKEQGALLKRDLDQFTNNQSFYASMGLPFRRGCLFSGPPGTGKSSLINAISAEYGRCLYYINLKNITDDADLQQAFTTVGRYSIIVLEDVDSQSPAVLARKKETITLDSTSISSFEEDNIMKKDNKKEEETASKITLSGILNVLDGHILPSGTLVIMTSNHPDVLDPAFIRPGRVDLHLRLDNCDKYQIQELYRHVMRALKQKEASSTNTHILNVENIPDGIIPPCDAMRIFMLYIDKSADFVSKKLIHRAQELISGVAVGDPVQA